MDAIKKTILSNGIAYASSCSFALVLDRISSQQSPRPDSVAIARMGLACYAARLALGALRSVRLVLRNRRDRTPVEIVAGRPPIGISHFLVRNVRQGFPNYAHSRLCQTTKPSLSV